MIDIRVSNSKDKTFRRCEKRYEYKYVLGLSRKKRERNLELGSWMHELLQTYYDGEDWELVHKRLTKEFYNMFEEEREDLGDLPTDCLRLMRNYLRHYPDDFSRYRVIDSEMDEIIELPNGVKLQIIVDLIVEDTVTGLIWPWDHKNRKNFGSTEDMLLDPQLTYYFTGLEMMGYKPLGGAVYNELCTKLPTVPVPLKKGGLSKAQKVINGTDVRTYMQAIKRHGLDIEDYRDTLRRISRAQQGKFFNRVFLPKDKPMTKRMLKELSWTAEDMVRKERTGRFTRTFIAKQCSWDCDYKDLCITDLHGGDIEPMIRAGFETREQRKKREMRERRRREKLRA